jgi:hypothetical protein
MKQFFASIPAGEIATVRVVCKQPLCPGPGVVELPLAGLDGLAGGKCPLCKRDYLPAAAEPNAFSDLKKGFLGLVDVKDRVDIEFIVPPK